MKPVYREIFRAIHEGKWIDIEYRNQSDRLTHYWVGVRNLRPETSALDVEGMHLRTYQLAEMTINVSRIEKASVLEKTYYPVNDVLVTDVRENPERYRMIFSYEADLRILTYYEMCHRMDRTPYIKNFELISLLDQDSLKVHKRVPLTDVQFQQIVKGLLREQNRKEKGMDRRFERELAMNELSVHTHRGLYLLAYRKLNLDVKEHVLRPDDSVTICTEMFVDGNVKESARRFLDADDHELLEDYDHNAGKIKDRIAAALGAKDKVDDMPYVIGLERDVMIDLHKEYAAICEEVENGNETIPIKAFFGGLLDRAAGNKTYPIVLSDNKANLDQLLGIHNALQNPISYIQGPPGTGKSFTIRNTILSAFFNERTVLFSSNNNHPLDTITDSLTSLQYRNNTIPFPVLRIGNREVVARTLERINQLRKEVRGIKVFRKTLDRRKGERVQRTRRLSRLLKAYETRLDLTERRQTLEELIDYENQHVVSATALGFTADLQGRQLAQVNEELGKLGEIPEAPDGYLDDDQEEFRQFLYYTSVSMIQRLEEDRFSDFRAILKEDTDDAVSDFNRYIGVQENLDLLKVVFPVIVSTCISASRLGEPSAHFDMVIIDEAGQCGTALSLVPILRGQHLMLVGDPQQLKPVVLLDASTNRRLRSRYQVTDEYDYRDNSVYKTFLACDSVSDEVLLRHHYRCHDKIIAFNNRKYYQSKLQLHGDSSEKRPLVFAHVKAEVPAEKNTSPEEARQIARYAQANRDKSLAVITPFVNQRRTIEQELKDCGVTNVECGTVHAFQGDEKDVVLLSTAITPGTWQGTYDWLKNNSELINVAVSRAKEKLIVLADEQQVERLHHAENSDDLYELIQYVKANGEYVVTANPASSRALGIKPYSTETEQAFLASLTHAMENIWQSQSRYVIHKEVPISQVFEENLSGADLFYTGRFDFVVYQKAGQKEIPVLAVELDGKEHLEDLTVQKRDARKEEICRQHNMELIRVENSYARRYQYIKDILIRYFKAYRG